MTTFVDAQARHRILTEFETTFFAEAAAGTGKTTALVGRIVGLVRAGLGTLDRIVAVTFTEKAAGEMKLRLRSELEKARGTADPGERGRLDRALQELELARIGTIHAFCGDILHERPVEAGVDPLFEVASDDEATALVDEAFESWFQRVLANPGEGVRRVLRRRSGKTTPREQLRAAVSSLCEHRDFPAAWRRDPFDRNAAIDALIDQLAPFAAIAEASSWRDDYLSRNLSEIGGFVSETIRTEAVRGRDYDGLEADLRSLARARSWTWKGAQRTTFGTLSRNDVLVLRDQAKVDLDAFVAAADADLAPSLREELRAPVAGYELLKVRAGRLDFIDLLMKVRDLVRDHAETRAELQRRFTHFFVDEFQDTDPLQAEILVLLAASDENETDWRRVTPVAGKLFLVGDPKQSVYRFRRADVAFYEGVKRRLLAAGAQLVHLTTSFRATPSIQAFVNGAFSPAMSAHADGSQAGYVPLHQARAEMVERPTIVALPVPKPYGDFGTLTAFRISESFPDTVGAFISWMVNESGWTVEDDGKPVAIRPRHIAVLFRRLRDFGMDITRSYTRALEARRIPHVLVGGRSFHDREEIIALRNVLTAIEWPDDELSVYATLRGPFLALADDALLSFRQGAGTDEPLRMRRLNPLSAGDEADVDKADAEVVAALGLLRGLHLGRNRRPIAETITMFLHAVRAHAGIALWPAGEQALANCQRVIDMARQFEQGASSFRAFVEKLVADAETREAGEAPIIEEGTEGIRMMTVHKAKGLEFPVVILADPACPTARSTPSRHVDTDHGLWLEPLCGSTPVELLEAADDELRRDHAEGIRLAYVAATRARDLLVVPVCGDQPLEGWLEVLNPMLYPNDGLRQDPAPAPGCPAFGNETILDRGPQGVAPQMGSVRPGLHRPGGQGGPAIVWWDPAILSLDVEEQAALRSQHILEADPDGRAATAGEEQYAAWHSNRQTLIERASVPSITVQTVTASVSSGQSVGVKQHGTGAVITVDRSDGIDPDRPGGPRFGTLVHAILSTIEFNDDEAAVNAATAVHARLVGATPAESEAAIAAVCRALTHPVLRRAAASSASGGVRRETPVILKCHGGGLLEGVVDLAFLESTPEFKGWTIVDFKTDTAFAAQSAIYTAQVAAYAEAIGLATGLPARGVVLII